MEKVLKKYTTIPTNLYVKREADKQLKRILDEMERPGYVLVARQMGKTNLLLNAIREYRDENHLFAYVDLSNNFEEERECYRNIIDKIIEPNENLFQSIIDNLNSNRINLNLPPHKEYERELRQILSVFKGKIIIILDEIDALRSVGYSDNIFAQIRSNYFARTSYPAFNNLTYLLSGVIEPSDLIKDKNKSPFNIGEKIYLDDFSFEEHSLFILKSNLNITDEISREIFDWTNGNPRLTFDICSEIEDTIINNTSITKELIETIITKKYFIHFDQAPIDHIRDIVSKNKTIRKAVYNIQNKKPIESIETRRKLYLYGIINSKIDTDKVEIKNKIIEKALPIEWLDSLEKQSQDLFSIGLEKVDDKDFKEAIYILEDYLSNSELPSQNKMIANYNIGYSYYQLGDFKKALTHFAENLYTIELKFESFFYGGKTFRGVCNLRLENFNDGERILKELIEECQEGFPYHNALYNLGLYYFDSNKYDDSYKLFDKLLESVKSKESKDQEKLALISLTKKTQILYIQNKLDEAIIELEKAKAIADNTDYLMLEYYKYVITGSKDENILVDLSKRIINNNLSFNEKEDYEFSYTEPSHYRYLIELFKINKPQEFNDLLEYTANSLVKASKSEVLYNLAFSPIDDISRKKLLDRIIISNEYVNEDIKRNIFKERAILEVARNKNFADLFETYLQLFLNSNVVVDVGDITLFAHILKYHSDRNNIEYAIKLCDYISDRLVNLSEDLSFESIIIYYWYSNLHFSKKDNINAKFYADKTIKIIESFNGKRNSIIDEKGIKIISDQMHQIIGSSSISKPIVRATKKYNRNDKVKVKYIDNSTKTGKYKNFEADIIAERCSIVEQ